MFNKLDKERKPIFKYTELSLLQTKDGMSYFGMHNNDYLNLRDGRVTLYAVREIPTETLNISVGTIIGQIGEKIGILDALKIPMKEIFNAAILGTEIFQEREKITVNINNIKRMDELPDYHEMYHGWNVNMRELTDASIK